MAYGLQAVAGASRWQGRFKQALTAALGSQAPTLIEVPTLAE